MFPIPSVVSVVGRTGQIENRLLGFLIALYVLTLYPQAGPGH